MDSGGLNWLWENLTVLANLGSLSGMLAGGWYFVQQRRLSRYYMLLLRGEQLRRELDERASQLNTAYASKDALDVRVKLSESRATLKHIQPHMGWEGQREVKRLRKRIAALLQDTERDLRATGGTESWYDRVGAVYEQLQYTSRDLFNRIETAKSRR
ncbi:MAG: hypothetical protein AAF730_13960 [Bacteroidota bacterium]